VEASNDRAHAKTWFAVRVFSDPILEAEVSKGPPQQETKWLRLQKGAKNETSKTIFKSVFIHFADSNVFILIWLPGVQVR
jgi:hypothetical protein